MHINLLPPSIRFHVELRAAIRRWRLLWAAVAGVTLLGAGMQIQNIRQLRLQLELANTRCRPLESIQQQSADNEKLLARLSAESNLLQRLKSDDHVLEILGVLVAATKASPDKLQVQRLALSAVSPPTSAEAQAKATSNLGSSAAVALNSSLSLQGIAADDTSLAQFVSAIRATNAFEQVDLKSSTYFRTPTGSGRQYQLECHY